MAIKSQFDSAKVTSKVSNEHIPHVQNRSLRLVDLSSEHTRNGLHTTIDQTFPITDGSFDLNDANSGLLELEEEYRQALISRQRNAKPFEAEDLTSSHRDTIVDFARRGDEEKVREVLHKRKLRRPASTVGNSDSANDSLGVTDDCGWTALHWSAEGGGASYGGATLTRRRLQVMRALLENIAQGVVVDARDENGATPLTIAVRCGNAEGCRLLLRHGADFNAGDDCGWTPLHWAAGGCRPSPLISTTQGVHRSRRPPGPLAASLSTSFAPVASWWDYELRRGAADAFAPLTDILRLLLRSAPRAGRSAADVRRSSAGGDTPLHVAVVRGQSDAVQMLLGASADAAAANVIGETPLHLAVAAGHTALVPILLAAGAPPPAVDRRGVTVGALWGARVVRLLAQLVQPERAGVPDDSAAAAALDAGLAAWLDARGVRSGAVLAPLPDPAEVLAALDALGCSPPPSEGAQRGAGAAQCGRGSDDGAGVADKKLQLPTAERAGQDTSGAAAALRLVSPRPCSVSDTSPAAAATAAGGQILLGEGDVVEPADDGDGDGDGETGHGLGGDGRRRQEGIKRREGIKEGIKRHWGLDDSDRAVIRRRAAVLRVLCGGE